MSEIRRPMAVLTARPCQVWRVWRVHLRYEKDLRGRQPVRVSSFPEFLDLEGRRLGERGRKGLLGVTAIRGRTGGSSDRHRPARHVGFDGGLNSRHREFRRRQEPDE